MKDLEGSLRYTKEGQKYHEMLLRLKKLVEEDTLVNSTNIDSRIEDFEYHIRAARETYYAGELEAMAVHWGNANAHYINCYSLRTSIEEQYQQSLAARTKVIELQVEIGKKFDILEYQLNLEQTLEEVNDNLTRVRFERNERLNEIIQLYRFVDEEENLSQAMILEEERSRRQDQEQREREQEEERKRETW